LEATLTEVLRKISSGLCSVTLRQSARAGVLDAAVAAGLDCVEWGGDIHVPPGDPAQAARAAAESRDRGIRVASYGSYFRAGPHGAAEFAPILESAVALGAPRIRIWAGDLGSAGATGEHRGAVVAASRAAAARAADAGITLAFEYHGGTLTDTAEGTVRLLQEIDHPAVTTYWQPPVAMADDDALAGLRQVLPWVCAVHVFSWWPTAERLPLADRAGLWRQVFAVLRETGRPCDALLEFVPGDSPAQVTTDARTLAALLPD
jgi:3-dehydroshikimate dehydratase